MEGVDPQRVAANLAEIREEVGPDVRVLVAVKYVDVDGLRGLVEGGVSIAGENRAQALTEKHAAFPDLEWHFIGQLQSRKVRDIVGRVRLIHSVGSLSACSQIQARAESPADCLLEVNVAGEDSKAGVPLAEVGRASCRERV